MKSSWEKIMKRVIPDNIQEILNKCEGNSCEIKDIKSLIALKDYKGFKNYFKSNSYLNNSDIDMLINYYQSLSYKRKLTEIGTEVLKKRYDDARKKLDIAKLSDDNNIYNNALQAFNESYIVFVGDILIESMISKQNNSYYFSSGKFENLYVPIEKADQIFLIEWIE